MRGEGLARQVVNHLICVAVVSRHKGAAAQAQNFIHQNAHIRIHLFDGGFGRGHDAGVAHHVAIGVVENHHIVLARADGFQRLLGHLGGRHLGLEVKGGHLAGRHQNAVLPGVAGLDAAVEEEGDVGVFLRLGDMQLGEPQAGEVFGQRHAEAIRRVDHAQPVAKRLIVLGHADKLHGNPLALKAGEIRVQDGAGQLAGAVRPEIEEDDAVVGLHGGHGLPLMHDDGGFDKFVVLVLLVALLHGLIWAEGGHAAPQGNGVIAQLHTRPDVVAVHAVVAALDAGDLTHADLQHLLLQLAHIAQAAGGRRVAAIQQGVHIDAGQAPVLGHAQQGVQVGVVAVHPAVAQQANEVQGLALLLGAIHRPDERLLLKQVAIQNVLGDAGQFLIHHAARADVEVAHLAVAHLPVGQAYAHAAGAQLGVGIGGHQPVHIGGTGGQDGIALRVGVDAKAIHDNQRCQFLEQSVSFQAAGQQSPAPGRSAATCSIPHWAIK